LDVISDFELFRAIVDAGSISAGALALQSSPAAVSRRLSELERKLGVRLAQRSSRRFRLTDEGSLLYERSRAILESVRDGRKSPRAAEFGARGACRASGFSKRSADGEAGSNQLCRESNRSLVSKAHSKLGCDPFARAVVRPPGAVGS
jgi:regulatory helix-turn-helix LysR family protein